MLFDIGQNQVHLIWKPLIIINEILTNFEYRKKR